MMMFQSARLKLTAWYLLIIMAISASFSIFVYHQITFEVRRGLRLHTLRVAPDSIDDHGSESVEFTPLFAILSPNPILPLQIDETIYNEIQHRVILQLLAVNLGIFAVSGLAGYFLAGKTLQPIEIMVDDQKRFVADASHELRTPLTAMKTEIEVALRDKRLDAPDAKKLLQSNLEEVDKMQTLSNYLLSLSRYQNTDSTTSEVVKLKDIVSAAIQKIEHQAKQKDIVIEQDVADATIRGNALAFVELITILLDNAIKYSHPSGKVVIRVKSNNKTTIIEVSDFGIGIKENEIPYIFNRFYRANLSRNKTRVDGFGLGLSIAKRIVELNNGKIEVKSVVNKGTTFRITF